MRCAVSSQAPLACPCRPCRVAPRGPPAQAGGRGRQGLTLSPAEGADGGGRGGPGPVSAVRELCFQQHRCRWAGAAERAGVAWAEPLPPPPRPQGGFRAPQGLRPCQCRGTRPGSLRVRALSAVLKDACAWQPTSHLPRSHPLPCPLFPDPPPGLPPPRSCVPRPTSPPPRQERGSALSSRPPQGERIRGKRVLRLAAPACSLPEGNVGLPGGVAPPALLAPAQALSQAPAPDVAQRPSTAAAGLRLLHSQPPQLWASQVSGHTPPLFSQGRPGGKALRVAPTEPTQDSRDSRDLSSRTQGL